MAACDAPESPGYTRAAPSHLTLATYRRPPPGRLCGGGRVRIAAVMIVASAGFGYLAEAGSGSQWFIYPPLFGGAGLVGGGWMHEISRGGVAGAANSLGAAAVGGLAEERAA